MHRTSMWMHCDLQLTVYAQTSSGEKARQRLVGSVWNAFGTIGRKIWVAVQSGSVAIPTYNVVAFLLDNQTVIQLFWTKAMGPAGDWFRLAIKALKRLL